MNFKKIILGVTFLIIAGSVFSFYPQSAKAQITPELQSQIVALMQQIRQLQEQLTQLQVKPVDWCYDFNINLRIRNTGDGIKNLQIALQREGLYEREITSQFDEYTASIVVAFQEKYAAEILAPLGLKCGTGFVGPFTRAKLNKIYGCDATICAQVITPAQNPTTGECKEFSTPGDVPAGWLKVTKCPPPTTPSITVISTNGGERVTIGDFLNYRVEIWNVLRRGNTTIHITERNTADWALGRYYFLGGAQGRDPSIMNPIIDEGGFGIVSYWVPGNYYLRVEWVNEDGTGRMVDFSDAPFSIVDSILPMACPSLPCYFDGKTILNASGTVDSPPYYISAKYPYEFNLSTQANVIMTLRYQVWQETLGIINAMHVRVNGEIVFVESGNMDDWGLVEINLGTLSSGKHTIEIYAFPNERHFMFDWFRIDTRT